ncbi:hypothetical protein B0A50_05675 [Salinomyces thailandicus]|uniref:J domain-containing protein n=1 Tax=Salinomyces thailandicus TaxID=706561 RepID=A0A4U0TRJ6_9PEZI|nr:hypothetical protein B0A50_05675 [Salinomyces thailandica]
MSIRRALSYPARPLPLREPLTIHQHHPIRHPPTTHRPFHTRTRHQQQQPTYYTTLDLPPTATPAEIKKQFYRLSKAHHPDLHPNDPAAAKTFVQISEAHATLGSPEKKEKYDREVLGRGAGASSAGGGAGGGGGSFSSSGPGGRPASGLSRRRTQFRGPPPSFYRSGGWGAQGSKRAESASQSSHAYEASGGGGGGGGQHASSQAGFGGGTGTSGPAGTGPGGFTEGFEDDVGHFDSRGHRRRQADIERTRHRARRKSGRGVVEPEVDYDGGGGNPTVFNFVVVSGVLGVVLGSTRWLFGGEEEKGARKKGEE